MNYVRAFLALVFVLVALLFGRMAVDALTWRAIDRQIDRERRLDSVFRETASRIRSHRARNGDLPDEAAVESWWSKADGCVMFGRVRWLVGQLKQPASGGPVPEGTGFWSRGGL